MKPGFMLYHDLLETVRLLTDQKCGRLLKSLLEYSLHSTHTPLDDKSEIIFIQAARLIDRDRSRYEIVCESRRRASAKRWNKPETEYDDAYYERLRIALKESRDSEDPNGSK